MAMKLRDQGTRIQFQKPRSAQLQEEGRLPGPGEVKVTLSYLNQGNRTQEDMIVPRALIFAMSDPGESRMNALEAMEQLAGFYDKAVRPDLQEMSMAGGVSIPHSVLSAQIRYSYDIHALIAATDAKVQGSLFLDHPEVQKKMKVLAAILSGVDVSQVRELDLDQTTVWVERTVTTVTKTPHIQFQVQRIECDIGSHREVKDVSVPVSTTVAEAKTSHQQRLARIPQIHTALDDVYGTIELYRGSELSPQERDAVVAHVNVNYIADPKDRLTVHP